LTPTPAISVMIPSRVLFLSLSKEHLSLGLNVSLNEKNEVIIYAINPNGPIPNN
jgi:hypothetical protein